MSENSLTALLALMWQQLAFLALAFVLFAIFWGPKKSWFSEFKLQSENPTRERLKGDLTWSLFNHFFLTALHFLLIFHGIKNGWFKIYFDWRQHSWFVLVGGGLAYVILGDLYRYWVHRILHHPRLFLKCHYVHHLSKTPTPMSLASIHPLEFVLFRLFFWFYAVVFPVHVLVVSSTLLVMQVCAILRHLGYDPISPMIRNVPVLKEISLGADHDLHHTDGSHNFGVLFSTWDRMFGTADPRNQETLDRMASARLRLRGPSG